MAKPLSMMLTCAILLMPQASNALTGKDLYDLCTTGDSDKKAQGYCTGYVTAIAETVDRQWDNSKDKVCVPHITNGQIVKQFLDDLEHMRDMPPASRDVLFRAQASDFVVTFMMVNYPCKK